jgi:putative PIG3 family NAD(P)H quinone oxidoreductase
MRVITFDQPGDSDVLHLAEVPDLAAGAGELLVHVRATAVNRADIFQRRGSYPPPAGASDILGLEMAGEIAALGSGVTSWAVGDRVCALLPGGGYAEQVVIPAEMALPIPDSVSFEQAAAFPEVFFTAYDNLFNWGRLKHGEIALIHGGGSGIGTAAIQLACWRGVEVIVTAGSAEKIAQCVQLGAKAGINYRSEDWPARVRELTDGHGVAVILDIIGGSYLAPNLASLAIEGRLVVISTLGGATTEIDLRTLMAKRLTLVGTTLRARPLPAKIALTRQIEHDLLPALADGTLRPIIHQVFDLADAAAAHRLMESSEHFGKIVLRVDPA